jgi:hypothetical protein
MALAVTEKSTAGLPSSGISLRLGNGENKGIKDLTSADLEKELKQIRTNSVVPYNGQQSSVMQTNAGG